jgi:hypothetical protein
VYNDTTDGPVCIGAGTACGQVAGICGANGACGNCGALNQPCCGGGSISGHSCTASGTTCVEDPEGSFTCRPCGDLGQRCCYEPIGNLPVCRATLRCVGPIDSQSCMP